MLASHIVRNPALRIAGLLALCAATLTGCSDDGSQDADDGPGCMGGKCDDADSDELREELASRKDPIGRYLLAELDAGRLSGSAEMEGDYDTVLRGVAAIQGCSEDSIRTFVVSDTLLTQEPFPRIVSTVCSGNKSAEFFISAPEERHDRETGERTGDLELQFIEMFAFDKDKDEYIFYETSPTNDEAVMAVNAAPTRCQQCHLTPSDHAPDGMRMTPVMNELTQPWTHWNGEPGFASHQFSVPDRARESHTWTTLVEPFLSPAADFEKLIRRGHFLAAKERRKAALRGDVSWRSAMNLMRPVFCNEQVQYVTSKGGQVLDSVIIDPSISSRMTELGLSYDWLQPVPNNLLDASGAGTVDQIPVRGNADLIVENQLIDRGLTTEQVLRARAVDWQTPVFSSLRCGLWVEAYKRYDEGDAPDLGSAAELEDALPVVFEDVMSVLPPPADGRFIALGDASEATTTAAATGVGLDCEEDGTGACMVTAPELGDLIGVWVDGFVGDSDQAAQLESLRDERICHILEDVNVDKLPVEKLSGRFNGATETRFANRPSLPDPGFCETVDFEWPFGEIPE